MVTMKKSDVVYVKTVVKGSNVMEEQDARSVLNLRQIVYCWVLESLVLFVVFIRSCTCLLIAQEQKQKSVKQSKK